METESGDGLGKTAVFTAVPGPLAHEFAGEAVHSGRLGVSEEGAGFSFEHAKKCVGANDGFELGLFWRGQLTLGALGSEFVVSGLRLSVGLDADERAGEFEGETLRERSEEPFQCCRRAICHARKVASTGRRSEAFLGQ